MKTYGEWKDLGLFDLMPNGFDLILDDEQIDDCEEALFEFDIDTNEYKHVISIASLTRDELIRSEVTYIGSNTHDFTVPALWINPPKDWHEKWDDIIHKKEE